MLRFFVGVILGAVIAQSVAFFLYDWEYNQALSSAFSSIAQILTTVIAVAALVFGHKIDEYRKRKTLESQAKTKSRYFKSLLAKRLSKIVEVCQELCREDRELSATDVTNLVIKSLDVNSRLGNERSDLQESSLEYKKHNPKRDFYNEVSEIENTISRTFVHLRQDYKIDINAYGQPQLKKSSLDSEKDEFFLTLDEDKAIQLIKDIERKATGILNDMLKHL